MQDEDNIIKSITTHICPHCGEEIFVESQMAPPVVASIFTTSDVELAKKDCLTRIETLTIDEDKRASVIKWIENPNVIFGPDEVEKIILSLLKPEE